MTTNNEMRRDEAGVIINHHVYWAVGAGLIPMPLADIAAVTAIQLDMLKSICDLYEIDYSKEKGKSWIAALAGSTLSSVLAKMGASALKTIPAIGTAIGMASMSILSGASTYAVGQVFVNHFEGGGTLGNFDAEKFQAFYKEKEEEGKKIASDLKDKYKSFVSGKSGEEKEKSAAKKLKELKSLKKKGLISSEEYKQMRKEVLQSLLQED